MCIFCFYLKIICTYENEVWGVSLRSPTLIMSLKSVFLILWELASPVTDELVRSWGENDFYLEEKKRG